MMKSTVTNLTLTPFIPFLCILLLMQLSGCSEPTVGQQFRDIMAEIDAECRKKGIGPYLSPDEPPRSRKRTDGSCEILKVKPADPLATAEGRFAYAIQLPPPHNKPKVSYDEGRGPGAYFEDLCEKEEGDFIFRAVDEVKGIKIMRPLPKETGVPLWNEAGGPPPGYFLDVRNGIYEYVDAVEFVQGARRNPQLFRYVIDSDQLIKEASRDLRRFPIETSATRYGFTFRNSPLENREHGIVGQELIILDLETSEILAFRRRFGMLKFDSQQSVQLMRGVVCRELDTSDSDNRFIARVLKPAMPADGARK